MRRPFLGADHHARPRGRRVDLERRRGNGGRRFGGAVEADLTLARRQRQIDLGQQLRVEQRAVQLPMGVVDPQPLAQRVERIALAREALARQQ